MWSWSTGTDFSPTASDGGLAVLAHFAPEIPVLIGVSST